MLSEYRCLLGVSTYEVRLCAILAEVTFHAEQHPLRDWFLVLRSSTSFAAAVVATEPTALVLANMPRYMLLLSRG